ncbi:hypothetical protein Hdeb2414_s0006g00213061 [Helianthus debilis subsp. tardiflorus]
MSIVGYLCLCIALRIIKLNLKSQLDIYDDGDHDNFAENDDDSLLLLLMMMMFTEEVEDLCQRVKDGLLKRPTVWLPIELAHLQNLIDRANEKGWRKEYPFLSI